jgi:hypothetical protein
MSRNYHVHANEVAHVVNDIRNLSPEEAEQFYGIKIADNGSVFDPVYNRKFETVTEWAEFNVNQDETEYEEEFNGGRYSDYDDY